MKQVSVACGATVSPPPPGEITRGPLRGLPTPKTPGSTGEYNWEQLPLERAWGHWGGESLGFPSRRTLPRGLCQIVSPNPAFLLGRAASGEVACPAAVFTVLRRHWESDLGRPGWAAPLGPSRVHTHFPDTEHGQPPASLVQLPGHPPMEGPASCRQATWMPAECTRAKESRTEPGKREQWQRRRGTLPPDRLMLRSPAKVLSIPSVQAPVPYWLADRQASPRTQSSGLESATVHVPNPTGHRR